MVIVTRHGNVKSVLDRGEDFTLTDFAEKAMLSGSFLLNLDWPEQHDREDLAVVGQLSDPGDMDRIRKIAAIGCQEAIKDAKQGARPHIDVVVLANKVALDVVEQYYGVPTPKGEREKMTGWLRDLAAAILVLPPEGSYARYETENSADEMCFQLDRLVRERTKIIKKTPSESKDTVLDRLVEWTLDPKNSKKVWVNEDWVRRMISGLIIFGTATIVRTAADTIDELLKRRNVLANAVAVANSLPAAPQPVLGEHDEKRAELRRYIYEALRFRPMLPVLARYCLRATTIESTGDRSGGRLISAGAVIIAPPLAAMFDSYVFEKPGRFSIDRETDDYLLFGSGMHKCIGQHIADVELAEIVRAVLSLHNLRRAPGPDGRIRYDGPAARSLNLMFDK
jgi:cytochrome P450